MTIEDLLKSKVIENPIKRFKKELEEIVNSSLLSKLLSKTKLKKEVAEFGLELLKLKDNYYSNYISLGSKEAEKFAALFFRRRKRCLRKRSMEQTASKNVSGWLYKTFF